MADQLLDDDSILNYYKKLLALRKCENYSDIFVYGDFKAINKDVKDLFVYTRSYNEKSIAVIVNMKNKELDVTLPFNINKVLLSNYKHTYKTNLLKLKPFETIVCEI